MTKGTLEEQPVAPVDFPASKATTSRLAKAQCEAVGYRLCVIEGGRRTACVGALMLHNWSRCDSTSEWDNLYTPPPGLNL